MDFVLMSLIATLLGITAVALSVLMFFSRKARKKSEAELGKKHDELLAYKAEAEPLKKYLVIVDAEKQAKRIAREAMIIEAKAKHAYDSRLKALEAAETNLQKAYDEKLQEAIAASRAELKEERVKVKQTREKAEQQLIDAHELVSKIEEEAHRKAQEIAGEAWEAKGNADHYEQTVKAMKNVIKGYGDEYLIPNESLLDELAEDYDHKAAGQDLAKIRTLIKSMIKNQEVAECDYVEPHRKATAIEFVVDAFNGKIDTVMAKVKHDNYGKLKQQVEDAFRIVNHNGKAFRNARIQPRYFETVLEQLTLAVAVQELKRRDQEEQRDIKAQMREEERARREYEKAIKKAQQEERMLQEAMAAAEKKLSSAAEEERSLLEEELAKLREQLAESEGREERALSMAQQTKQGHVYIISNIGSFGEEVFKIGLTRRLEPFDRVKELGDASVPFSFDVHAMIHSDNAPALEAQLHNLFNTHRVNKVNHRKEFFRVPLTRIKQHVEEFGAETHWTLKSEALEFRETLQMEKNVDRPTPTGQAVQV